MVACSGDDAGYPPIIWLRAHSHRSVIVEHNHRAGDGDLLFGALEFLGAVGVPQDDVALAAVEMNRRLTLSVQDEDVALIALPTHPQLAVLALKMQHLSADVILYNQQLSTAVEVEFELTIVTTDAQVTLGALSPNIEHREPGVKREHFPVGAVHNHEPVLDSFCHGVLSFLVAQQRRRQAAVNGG